MKKILLAMTVASILTIPMQTFANATPETPAPKPTASEPAKPGQKGNAKALQHANFMPVLMKEVMKNRVALNLTEEQLAKLKAFQTKNLSHSMAQVKEVVALEKQAKALALKDGDAQEIISLGEKSLKIRHDIMTSKIKCRDFVKSVLTAEQYQQVLANYGQKTPKKPA